MKQIKIGTCVPGPVAEEWLKGFVGKGFETFSLNFHMSLEGTDLDKLALSTEKILAGTDSKITTLGYYCNPIQYPEHRKTLEKVICTAEKFGATHVSTFAGAWEGKPVESAYEEFGKVFRELAELAEEKGVKLGIENCLMDGTWEHATCNIGFNPKAWEVMFEEVKNDNFGLEWEPTHQMVQLIDPVTELRKWCKKIVHVHGKDATIDWDAVRHGGISGAVPFVWHRMPGFGDTNWDAGDRERRGSHCRDRTPQKRICPAACGQSGCAVPCGQHHPAHPQHTGAGQALGHCRGQGGAARHRLHQG